MLIMVSALIIQQYKENPLCSYVSFNKYAGRGEILFISDDSSVYYIYFGYNSSQMFDEISLVDVASENYTNNLTKEKIRDIFDNIEINTLIGNINRGFSVYISSKSKLNLSEESQLKNIIKNTSFFTFEESYSDTSTLDLSHIYITLWNNNGKKTVSDYNEAAPEDFYLLFNELINIKKARWNYS